MASRSVYVPVYEVIKKENGKIEAYDFNKAKSAVYKAMEECDDFKPNKSLATKIAKEVEKNLSERGLANISTNDWANEAISVMNSKGYKELSNTYKKHIVQKSLNRLKNSSLMKSFNDVLGSSGDDPNSINTENANIDGFNPAAQLHRIGSEANKGFILDYLLPRNLSRIHREKWIHIHDLDYFELNPNCLQIDLKATLKDGFSTGNGLNTEPHSILTATMLTAIVLQSSTNNMHGGQSIMNLDYALAKYVNLSYRKHFQKAVENYYMISGKEKLPFLNKRFYNKLFYGIDVEYIKKHQEDYLPKDEKKFTAAKLKVLDKFIGVANKDTEKETNQAMQGLCHNLSTLHSRAADQVPFSSVNLGLDISEAGRLVTRCLLNNLIGGSGRGETFIYPITIFHVLEGINYFPSDPNYDLLQLAMKSSSTRLYPNYVFVDSPFQYVYIRDKHGKLLWKARENWYIDRGLVTKEELDSIESQDNIYNSNVYERIRRVAEIDRKLRKSNKANEDLFDVVKFMTGKGNPNFDKKARINGCQYPSAIDSLRRGFDDRTTPARMGCRTLTISDALAKYGIDEEPSKRYKFERNVRPPYGYTAGRGNFNFVTLNLPRFAIDAIKNTKHAKLEQTNTGEILDQTLSKFYKNILFYMIEAKNILKIKLEIIGKKPVKNFSFITGEGLVLGSYGMKDSDKTEELWHHFSKSIGYIGIYETIMLLYNKTQIEKSEEAFNIILFMRKMTELMSKGYYILPTEEGLKDNKWYEKIFNTDESTYSNSNLEKSEWDEKFQVYDIDNNPICLRNKNKLYKDNWSVFATPAEGACSSFCKADFKEYGKIKNVTDKDYYTNSNHIDVREKVTVEEKANFEGRFHTLATAGNIFYVEADGVIGKNNKAYRDILTVMHDNEMGYVAVNVPNDHCEVCRYQGVIPEGENCPHCGAGEENITRIRRITGYLGYTNKGGHSRFNSGKAAEEKSRVKHV